MDREQALAPYIELISANVERRFGLQHQARFWHWLGNVKFKEQRDKDGGMLTVATAGMVVRDIRSILDEFEGSLSNAD